ncbi:hypothetical protein Mpt1_c11800 [Candidatus Methanoplasma termitum]|uniref:Ig-like domain-containing protein n=2 Tax=Candidatus Methanoplasma termitum TaxID=1577791 RepID=A0A0A7LFJ6_9ARCH|nr:hypothetical protein Mpt1_c11800 [Candidatus Methanoplasma termitum]
MVSYDGTNYNYKIGTGAVTTLASNVIYFTGAYGTNCITFGLTGNIPFPDDNRLYVVLDSLTITNGNTGGAPGTNNSLSIAPGAKIIMQLLGSNIISNYGGTNCSSAAISNVKTSNGIQSDMIITGQGMGSLTITRNITYNFSTGAVSGIGGPDPSIGALIGGNGTTGNANSGDSAGHIQIESGILRLANGCASRIRGSCIGGGGTIDGSYNGGEGADFEMHGGSITTYQQANGASLTAPAIGGGGQFNGASNESGSGNYVTITGGTINITQVNGDATYGLRTAAIGGAGTGSGKGGDSGIILISGGDITINQKGAAVSGSGIGSGAAQYSGNAPGQATGYCAKSGHDNYISISGGSVKIYQTNSSPTYGCLTGAGIGGGAGSDSGIGGGGADVRISGGYVLVNRSSTGTISRAQGAAIGGGAEETKPSNIIITGGNVNVIISITSGTDANNAGAALGSNLKANPKSTVQIDGGVINIQRLRGTTPMTVPIGSNGDFGSSPIINGGSIRASGNMDLTSGGIAVKDTPGHSLVRYIVNLDNVDNPQSLFVRKADVLYEEYDFTKRYVNFHVQGRHMDLQNQTVSYPYYNLYLPAGTAADPNEISLEYKSNGEVKTFTAYGGIPGDTAQTNKAVQTSNLQPGDPVLYRVVYRIGSKLRYEDDTVHIAEGAKFVQSFRALNAYLGEAVAPWSLSYVERHNIDYNNAASPGSLTDVVELDGQWKYYASENRLVNPTGVNEVATSYGNIEFDTDITGRLVITADYTDRVNFVYSDPQLGTITRIMGSGYPDFKIGYTKEADPWGQQPGSPVASAPPELSGTVWTSAMKGNDFVEWREGNMQTGASRNTGDMYGSVIPQGVSTTTFYAMWKAETPTLAITQQPQATVTIDNMSNAVFTVKAISTTSSALTYNWQYWDSGWKDLSGVGFTGADTNMLQISPYNYLSGSTPTFTTGNTFQCVVKDSANNTVYSQPASLVVTGVTGTPPSTPAPYSPNNTIQILTAPDDVTALSGTNAVFSVNAICSSSILYRWQVSTDGGAVWNTIAGATSNTYTAANVSNTDNGKLYRCIMTSTNPTYENIIYTSTPAKLTVISSALYTINVNVAIQNATIGTGGFVQPNSSDKIVNKVTTTTGTPDYSFSAVSGTSQTFTITPIYGNGLVSLKDGGTDIPYTKNPDGTFVFTLTNITAAHNIVATFAPGYLVDVTFAGTGSGSVSFVSQDGTSTGTLNATGQIFVPYNNSVTLTASATAPNVFVSWTGNTATGGLNSANPAITIGPMGDNSGISETVTFSTTTLTWQLTLDPAGGAAEVSYDNGVTVFQYPGLPMNIPNDKTTTVELKTPPAGKTFSYWYGGTVGGAVGSEVYTDAKFTVPAGNEDKKYTAAYVSSTTAITITVLSDPTGVTWFKYSTVADVWVPAATDNTFKVDPGTPFQIKAPLTFGSLNLTFLGWSGKEKDNEILDSPGVTANTSFTALYYNINTQALVTLTASPSSLAPDFTLKQNNVGLSFVTDGNNRVFAVTKDVSFTATAPMTTGTSPVYTLQGWSGEPAGADLTKTINTPMTYTALYYNPLTQAIVTLNPSPNTISPAFTLNQGGDLSFITNTVGGREFIVNMGTPFTATAPMTVGTSPVYNFQGWSGKTSGTATLTDTIPMGGSNQTYTALYYNQLTQAIVTLKADPSTLAPAFALTQGSNVLFTVNPTGGMDFIVNMGTPFTASAPPIAGTSPVYSLLGWAGKTSGTATLTDTIPMGGSNQTYIALYYNPLTQAIVTLVSSPTAANPAFTLDQGGNKPYTLNATAGMDFIVNMGTAFTATAPTTAGTSPVYNFLGWSGMPTGTVTLTDTIPTGGANKTYTAIYYNTATQAIVTLKANPNTISPAFTMTQASNPVLFTTNPAGGRDFIVTKGTPFTANAPTMSGYNFLGWADHEYLNATLSATVTADTTFTAIYYDPLTQTLVTLEAEPNALAPVFTLKQSGASVPSAVITGAKNGRIFAVLKGTSFDITAPNVPSWTFMNWINVGPNMTETISAGVSTPTTYVALYTPGAPVTVILKASPSISPPFTLYQNGYYVPGTQITGGWSFLVVSGMAFDVIAPATHTESSVQYTLLGWEGELSGQARVTKAAITTDMTYTALYYNPLTQAVVTLVSSPTAANPAFTMTQASNSVPFTVNPAGGRDFVVTKGVDFTATAPMTSGTSPVYTLQGWSGEPSGTATLTKQVSTATTFTALYYDASKQVLVTLVSSPTAANPAFTMSQSGNSILWTANPAGGKDFAVIANTSFTATAPTTAGTSPVYTFQGWSGEASGAVNLTKTVAAATKYTALYYDANAQVLVTLISNPTAAHPSVHHDAALELRTVHRYPGGRNGLRRHKGRRLHGDRADDIRNISCVHITGLVRRTVGNGNTDKAGIDGNDVHRTLLRRERKGNRHACIKPDRGKPRVHTEPGRQRSVHR